MCQEEHETLIYYYYYNNFFLASAKSFWLPWQHSMYFKYGLSWFIQKKQTCFHHIFAKKLQNVWLFLSDTLCIVPLRSGMWFQVYCSPAPVPGGLLCALAAESGLCRANTVRPKVHHV